MTLSKGKSSRIFSGLAVLLSIAGIAYFGYRAVQDNLYPQRENPYDHDIGRYEKSGAELRNYTEIRTLPVPLTAPSGIALDARGRIYVSGGTRAAVFDTSGGWRTAAETGGPVRCLAADAAGRLYLGVDGHVELFEDGRQVSRWESLGERAIITSLSVGHDVVWIADAGNKMIWKFSRSGRLLGHIDGSSAEGRTRGFTLPSPFFDVAAGGDGRVWAAHTGAHRLELYSGSGKLLRYWGEQSLEPHGFSGCCNPAHFTLLDDGSFVTFEKGMPRIKVYSAEGELRSLVALPEHFHRGAQHVDLAADRQGLIYALDRERRQIRIFRKEETE